MSDGFRNLSMGEVPDSRDPFISSPDKAGDGLPHSSHSAIRTGLTPCHSRAAFRSFTVGDIPPW